MAADGDASGDLLMGMNKWGHPLSWTWETWMAPNLLAEAAMPPQYDVWPVPKSARHRISD